MVYIEGNGRIRLWSAVDVDGYDVCELTEDYQEAKRAAQDANGEVIEHTYQFVNSDPVEQFFATCEDCPRALNRENGDNELPNGLHVCDSCERERCDICGSALDGDGDCEQCDEVAIAAKEAD